jgi:hypothetical protein
MPDPLFASALLGAAIVAVGAWLIVCAVLPRTIRLGDAFGVLAEARPGTSLDGRALVADATSRLELVRRLAVSARPSAPAGRNRAHSGATAAPSGDYFFNKLVLAEGGFHAVAPRASIRPLTAAWA